ncbi:LacI family transcriptional regulator [Rhodobacter sp. TJ_12]|uniref:LacI family DNA-binding transcriptional regulator n=1 Tax=Rhodobacter sp. TJ_12 TaxID=2029399 RepID=UPI001CC132DC|nr:LacI family DNA-binding transcriptional regulator [Rhodobacter sp. TJ_12]MBZ4021012.1 LacI family transcriptional regulator [Rhodobacter sp. TJ_12]
MITPRKAPTMADVARLAGVSPMTVSRAFKAQSSVSETTREAILKAADQLGYVFDSTAASLRSQKTDFVAVTIPSINNANFAETLRGLAEGLKARGLQILLGYTDYDMAEEERLIEQFLRRRPEAMVVTGGKHTDRARKLLQNAAIPVIETWDLPKDPIGHVVGFSNARAVESMVDHLVTEGLSRIAFIGGENNTDTRGASRRAGFIAAMQRHGLAPTRLIAAGTPPISMREGAEAMARLLETFPDTQAVICVSDLSAFGALTECQRRRVDVPKDLWITGFGDYEISEISVPSLSTINPFPHDIGARSAKLILEVLDGICTAPTTLEITPELLIRQSSQ